MICLFCNGQECKYEPDRHVDFICGSCVILLADASQEDLKRAHAKAVLTEYPRKARAIESFLILEVKDGKRPTKSIERDLNRERTARPVRDKKRLPEPVEA